MNATLQVREALTPADPSSLAVFVAYSVTLSVRNYHIRITFIRTFINE